MTSAASIGLGAAAGWFAIALCLQALLLRLFGSGVGSLLPSGLLFLVGFVASILLVPGLDGWSALLALLFGGLGAFCLFALFVPFLYTVLTSVSVQSMVIMLRHGGSAAEADLFSLFASAAVVEGRLAMLRRSGYLAARGQGYVLTARGRAIARLFAAIKQLWRLGPGG